MVGSKAWGGRQRSSEVAQDLEPRKILRTRAVSRARAHPGHLELRALDCFRFLLLDGLGLVAMGPSESLESVVAHANISSKVGAA